MTRDGRAVAVVRWSTFPLLVGGATVAALLLVDRVAAELLVGAAGFAAVVIIAVLERIAPYRAAFNRARGDVLTDLLHNLISGIAVPEVARLVALVAVAGAGAWLRRQLGFSLWPTEAPLGLQLVLALLVAELPSYVLHRAQHHYPLWWRMHATHHSAPRLYWLNAGRFHPLDAIVSYVLLVFPLVLLGVPERTLTVMTVVITVHGLLQHSNVALAHGPLNWIFSTAELHRWHHAPDPKEGNHNFGVVLAVWDLVFGTRYLPRRPPPEDVGIGSMPDFPKDYLGQLASPFRWRAIGGRDPR